MIINIHNTSCAVFSEIKENEAIFFLLMCDRGNVIFEEVKKLSKTLLETSIVFTGIITDKSVPLFLHGKIMVKAFRIVCNKKRSVRFLIFN